ncbi:MAG: radical SAM protein [Lachnospiraceae bacterium]|nr:radical SAM protein [Lachnospiraceae bacterium]
MKAHRLILQFHITGRCNLNCKHCYRDSDDAKELSFDDIKSVIDQFLLLRKKYNKEHNIFCKGHINITGGEPFIRKDILDILSYLHSKKNEISYGVLSNGSFIDEKIMIALAYTGAAFVQLSIDGDEKTHDGLRKKGDYIRTFNKAAELEGFGIRTFVSFTANKDNYRYLPIVAKKCRKNGISKLWTDRLVPIGSGASMSDIVITANEMKDYVNTIKKAQGNYITRKIFPYTEVSANRALQFIGGNECTYRCSAGESLITVDEFGNIVPCRRMPIICGNIFTSTLEDIYYTNEIFIDLRKHMIPEKCKSCLHGEKCRGGARCQAYAAYGSYNEADPGCFLH